MYTEHELAALVESVEREFNAELAKAEQVLTKAEDAPKAKEDKKPEAKEKPEAPKKEEKPSEEAPAAEAKEEAPAAPEADAEEAPAEEAEEAPAAEAAPAHEDAAYDAEDLEHMHKMYSSMSPAERKAHHDALAKAGNECGDGMEKCGEMSPSAPAAAPMAKSEETVIEVKTEDKPNEAVEMLKSELASEKAKGEELKKSFDAVQEFLKKLVTKTAPKGKAITNLDAIAKSDVTNEDKTLTKSEITEILNKKDYSAMSKSDRDAVQSFYLGSGSINSINHLLK